MSEAVARDYSLLGEGAKHAVERGLAEADWYTSPTPRETLRSMLERRNGPAIRDTLLWFAILGCSAYAFIALWGSWWAVLSYMIYAVFYGTASDSRWHECSHGTAFRTDWMNVAMYELASFMVNRESTVWRWSHNRHHSDTIIVGRDPEIQMPRPPDLVAHAMSYFAIGGYRTYYPSLIRHACGRLTAAERTFIPESEFGKVIWKARLCVALYAAVLVASIVFQTWIPVLLIMLPQFFGTWLMLIHNTPQHAGLAENVLDHRLNCRTVYMNPISRFIYWNMNYHVEHHMFPLVPYHQLAKLHAVVKDDCPPPYPSILSAWREIWPTLLRQQKDLAYHVKRVLPAPAERGDARRFTTDATVDAEGWIAVCDASDLLNGDARRFDHGKKTYALYRDNEGALFATDGICTHGNTHLGDGMVIGNTIECPKHNGRFNLYDGSPARAPICRGLCTYPVEDREGKLFLNINTPGGVGVREEKTVQLRVVSNENVATFIKELIVEPVEGDIAFTPGDYLQVDIPDYGVIPFSDFDVNEPYASVWQAQHVVDLESRHPGDSRRNNYSLACNAESESHLRFNIRIATPPPGQDCPPGVGSAYSFNLKAGDTITAIGPFGDFYIKPTKKEMVYIGGGAGMAPIRAHLSHLFETEQSQRRVSYWYGARSRQEIFYQDYFEGLASTRDNFKFEIALSSPLDEDQWTGSTGMIHDVVLEQYLKDHGNLQAVEFYLCGPPLMVHACKKMLASLGVMPMQIAYDEF